MNPPLRIFWLCLASLLPVGPGLFAAPVDYAKEIQPLLAAKCYDCHGSDKNSKADLRLDRRELALKGGESGPALTAGQSAHSLLFQRVTTEDEDELMPPPGKGEKLTAAEADLLRRWLDEGAVWPEEALAPSEDKTKHWAFIAPVRPPVPEIAENFGVQTVESAPDKNAPAAPAPASAENSALRTPRSAFKNPVDAFIAQKLTQEGLAFSPPAEKSTWLRRVHFDLTGLPPTQAELAAFLADTAPDAAAKKIDTLLASPHFGERWARHWLDAARYADSQGYEKDPARYSVWFWRDWVINALNADMPYDQFIIEQIAGDLLPNATQDQIVATGFLRQSMLNEEGGVDPEQFRMEAMFDRMDCVGKAVLGLTIQCAQCHNHKFDPISQEDYFRMFAYLNNDDEPQRVVYRPHELQMIATLRAKMAENDAALKERRPAWREEMTAWEEQARQQPQPRWETLAGEFDLNSVGGCKYLPRPDGSYLAQSYAPTKHSAVLPTKTTLPRVTAFRLELLNDANLPCNGPGRSFKGTCALTEFKVQADTGEGWKEIKIASAEADFEEAPDQPLEPNFEDRSNRKRVTGPAAYAIDGKDETAWGIDAGPGRRNQGRVIVFKPAEPLVPKNGELKIILVQNHGGWNSDDLMNNNLGRFRLSVTDADTVAAPTLSPRESDALAAASEQRTAAQHEAIFARWRKTAADFAEENAKLEALWQQWPEGATALALQPRAMPRDTTLLKRGDWLQPGRPVAAGAPAILHQPPADAPPTRLTLAQWLAARESPTTARTFVNRVWQQLFGTGLVESAEDLGVQAEPPSHPELLDWLAVEFMEQGWSLKKTLRLIMTSRAYGQSSVLTPELYAKDPYNRLVARGPRQRVEAEIVRDVALSVSGLLNPAVGGPSVMAPAPLDLFQPPASYAPFPWVNATGADKYRRALYTFRRRSTPYPVLQAFDAPNGDQSCVRRGRSNTPMQALALLNEELFVDAARALGRRMMAEGGATTEERIRWAFRQVLSRDPDTSEINQLIVLTSRQKKRIADGYISASEVATGHRDIPTGLPAGATPAQLATHTLIARVLLSADEAITKE